MKIVFEGQKQKVQEMSSCGCACYQVPGGVATNKPTVQVEHII